MRNFVLGFGLLALASAGAAVTAGAAAQGPRGGETIRVYQSPT